MGPSHMCWTLRRARKVDDHAGVSDTYRRQYRDDHMKDEDGRGIIVGIVRAALDFSWRCAPRYSKSFDYNVHQDDDAVWGEVHKCEHDAILTTGLLHGTGLVLPNLRDSATNLASPGVQNDESPIGSNTKSRTHHEHRVVKQGTDELRYTLHGPSLLMPSIMGEHWDVVFRAIPNQHSEIAESRE